MALHRIIFAAAVVILTSCPAWSADDFYTNGKAIGAWDHFPNRKFTEPGGKVHVGYKQAYHFIRKLPEDIFLFQEIVIVADDDPDSTWVYDLASRVWKGRWDNSLGLYARLEFNERKPWLGSIARSAIPEAEDEPTLYNMVRRPNEPLRPDDTRKATPPPNTSKFSVAATDSKDLDSILNADSSGKPASSSACCVPQRHRCKLFRR